MKHLKFIFTIMLSFVVFQSRADKTDTPAEVIPLYQESIMTGIERSSFYLPSVNIIYDTETQSMEIVCEQDYNVSISIYDESGNLIILTDLLNIEFQLPKTSAKTYMIIIVSSRWKAIANVVV